MQINVTYNTEVSLGSCRQTEIGMYLLFFFFLYFCIFSFLFFRGQAHFVLSPLLTYNYDNFPL